VRLAAQAIARVEAVGHTSRDEDLAAVVEAVFGVDVAAEPLGDGCDGVAASSPEAKLILLATSHVPGRQRFTLAHELAHLLTGDDQGVHLDRDIFDRAQASRDPSEARANAFAAAFLMPETALRAAVTPPVEPPAAHGMTDHAFARLACDLLVTPAALAYRLLDLGLIDRPARDHLRTITGAQAAALTGRGDQFSRRVAQAGKRRPPGLLLRDTYTSYESGQATLRPYASLLGADVDELARALESEQGAPAAP
jgi:Zn-dependent peptidase ImmA (M78 family)